MSSAGDEAERKDSNEKITYTLQGERKKPQQMKVPQYGSVCKDLV